MAHLWSIRRHINVACVCCEALELPGIGHAFGTRFHDAGPAFSGDEDHRRARAELARLAGCGAAPGPALRQVHGARVALASDVDPSGLEADAVWDHTQSLSETCLAVRTADCVPILLATLDGSAVAAVHAGWRGTVKRIGPRAVDRLAGAGYDPRDLVAALGPSIGRCCYPVSAQVATQVAEASGAAAGVVSGGGPDGVFLDLREANRRQLIDAGIPDAAVHAAPWCTACEVDLFFSYRRDGEVTGRQFNLIGPTATRP